MLAKLIGSAVLVALAGGLGMACLQDPIPGGYSKAGVKEDEVVKAAKFAIKEQAKKDKGGPYKLEQIVSAQRQVVAGINYKLELKVQQKGKSQLVNAVIWKKLDGKHELTEWNVKGGEKEEGPGSPPK